MASIASPNLQRRKDADEEQLLRLFWNRAELKKELAKLRRERQHLADQLRQQETLNLRAQQRLEQLEGLLADPVQAANAVVYYQLRGVWQKARRNLVQLARELAERQREREERYALDQFARRRDTELDALDERLAALARQAAALNRDLENATDRLTQLRGFWNYFQRRSLSEEIAAAAASLEGVNGQIGLLRSERRGKENEEAPSFGGLTTEGKRNINLALIAMAQQMLVQLVDHNVAALAREASARGLVEVMYGTTAECGLLGRKVEVVLRRLQTMEGKFSNQARRRAEFLRSLAQYRRETDTIPLVAGFSEVPVLMTEKGDVGPADSRVIPVNVLVDEYWDIYTVLLE